MNFGGELQYKIEKISRYMPNIKYERHVPELSPKKEQPRNDKCNCESGLKYKKCCGIRSNR